VKETPPHHTHSWKQSDQLARWDGVVAAHQITSLLFSLPTLVCPQSSKHEERKQQQLLEAMSFGGGSVEKPEKKERGSKTKDKSMRDKNVTEEEKELRKERKLGRKRV
jgi:hypothetical protein